MKKIIRFIKQSLIIIDPLDEYEFEGRNKEYGAYVVRKKYNKNVRNALAATTFISLFFVLSYFIYDKIINNFIEMNAVEVSPNLDILPYLDNIQLQNIPLPEVKLPAGAVIQADENTIPDAEDTTKDDVKKKNIVPIQTFSQDTSSTKNGLNGTESDQASDYVVPTGVSERNAVFPGGEASRLSFIRVNIQYPAEAVKLKIGGKVIISFTIDKKGFVKNVTVVKSVHPLLDAEALRVVKMMPRWEPCVKHGKANDQNFKVPISFIPPSN